MKKLYFLSIIIFLLQLNLLSQFRWYNQQSGTTEDLNAVCFIDSSVGTVVGNSGTILRTTNGGAVWIKQSSGITLNLNNLTYIDSNNIFVVGDSGAILRTIDGGTTWGRQSNGSSNKLTSVSFINEKNGIAVGYNSTELTTTNGGNTWTSHSIGGPNFRPQYVLYQDSNNILIFGPTTSGLVQTMNSSDGGKTWVIYDTTQYGIDNYYNGASFVDVNYGMCVGYTSVTSQNLPFIYKTTNGGKLWKIIGTTPYDTRLPLYGVFCINKEISTVVGWNGSIFRTNNGGQTWAQQASGTNNALNNVFFSDSLNGTIVGSNGTILHTKNGGNTRNSLWSVNIVADYLLRGVSFADGNTAFAVGFSGILLRSNDGGISWNSVLPPTRRDFSDVKFINKFYGMVVGFDTPIFYTSDGGGDWISNTRSDFSRISLVDAGKAFGVSGSYVGYTQDWGENWSWQNISDNNLNGIFFINKTLGFAVGFGGTIFSTSNAGQTWQKQIINKTNDYYGVFFSDAKNGTVVGTNGQILHTNNGGITWTAQNSNTSNDLYDVFFTSKLNGIIVGANGTVLITSNGGSEWTKEIVNTGADLFGVTVKDSVVLCAGDGGTIVRYAKWGDVSQSNDSILVPAEFNLSQNYPNPFNPYTTIEYSIPDQTHVTIKVYDVFGREIQTLVNDEESAGSYKFKFDGTDLASGIYFYTLKTGESFQAKKMVMIK